MGGVDYNCVYTCVHESLHALESVACHTHAGSHAKTPFAVFAGIRIVLDFCDVAISDKAYELVVAVNHGEFLDFVAQENLRSLGEVGVCGGHDVVLGHHLRDAECGVGLEAKVAVSDNAHKLALLINHGYSADVVLMHHAEGVAHGLFGSDCHRVENHAAFSTFHLSYLCGLSLDRHVLVDNANAALARYGYSHSSLGHGVHCRRHDGDVESDVA